MSQTPSQNLEERMDVEPEIRRLAREYQRRLALERDLQLTTTDPRAFETAIRNRLDRLMDEDQVALRPIQKEQLIGVIVRDAIGYGPLDPLLHDPTVSEIMVNAPDEIYIERNGQMQRSQARFEDLGQLYNVIRRMAASVARRIDETSPMVDARLPDGSRLNAVIPPAALRGPLVTIRKFRAFGMGLDELIRESTITADMASFLEYAVRGRLSILVSGGTGCGKTTTLNVLGSLIPERERVVTIEDAAELQLQHSHTLGLEYRPPNVEGKGELTIRTLVRNSLRMRPDRIIVGEVRDAAAIDMLQAMNTGHDGSMSTIHANSAKDAFSRLEMMVLSGATELPLHAIRAQIASAVNLVLHQTRMPDGRRRIVQVAEVRGYENNAPVLDDIFNYDVDRSGTGWHVTTGHRPAGLRKMAFYGITPPMDLFEPKRITVDDAVEQAWEPAFRKELPAPAAPVARPSASPLARAAERRSQAAAPATPARAPGLTARAAGAGAIPVAAPAAGGPAEAAPVAASSGGPAEPAEAAGAGQAAARAVPVPETPAIPPDGGGTVPGAPGQGPAVVQGSEPASGQPAPASPEAGTAAAEPLPAAAPPPAAVAAPPPGTPPHRQGLRSVAISGPGGEPMRAATPGGLRRRALERARSREALEDDARAPRQDSHRNVLRSRIAETLGTDPADAGDGAGGGGAP